VADKSNEIVAIPRLLDMPAIEGATATIDAMGCQREIAARIIDGRADYVLGLKGNQGSLRDDAELFANEQKVRNFKDTAISQARTVDGDHGRIETRRTTVFHDIAWAPGAPRLAGLTAVVMVESERECDTRIERETRSSSDGADTLGDVVRRHWAVESMHWLMDCLFREPGANRACPGQLRHHQAHRPQPAAPKSSQALNDHQTIEGSLGRGLPHQPYLMKANSPDSPEVRNDQALDH
jgi:predicted transposase YbfD/YdcC